ncbi:MAG: hypothetical protein JOZ51_03425 [Chloroflexi bacterium]|nr:hypothetical protein [Chloroflexota bacterium]
MTTYPTQPPTNAQVEQAFLDLLSGRRSRDEIDRWAAQWAAADDPPDMDDAVWEALGMLFGCDMPDLDGTYLLDDRQIQQWYDEFRRATSG